MMETVFSRMYVDQNMQQNRRAMSGRAGNRDGGRYFQKMKNSWLSAFMYSDFVCHLESMHVPLVARVPRVGQHWSSQLNSFFYTHRVAQIDVYTFLKRHLLATK